jgi:hypothetical protein
MTGHLYACIHPRGSLSLTKLLPCSALITITAMLYRCTAREPCAEGWMMPCVLCHRVDVAVLCR